MNLTPHYTHEHAERQHQIDCFQRAIRTPEFKKIWTGGVVWKMDHFWFRDRDTHRITVRNGVNTYYHNADGSARIGRTKSSASVSNSPKRSNPP